MENPAGTTFTDTPLHDACWDFGFNLFEVEDADTRTNTGETALHTASRNGDFAMVQLLLEWGADVVTRTYQGENALQIACANSDIDIVCLLLKSGATLDAIDMREHTPLLYASYYGHRNMVSHLLFKGADVAVRSQKGCDQEMVIGTSRRRAYISSNAQKDAYLAKAHPSTPQKDLFKKIRLNLPAIEDEGISNLGDLLNQLYNKKVLDKNDMTLIEQANGRSNKTRELLFILFIKDPMAWVFDVLQHIKNSPDTVFLYQMIANTYTGLDSCHPADMWKIVMQADNRNHKAVVLKEMIRQNLMYLSRILTKEPLPEIDMSVFADEELEYITSQPDKKQEVKASLICLLGRKNVGWVFEFIRMLLNAGRNQVLVNVFGTTDATDI